MSGTDDEREPQDPPPWQTAPPPPVQPWGQPMAGWTPVAPTPGSATAALILGISSVIICPLVCPAAILLGRRAVRQIDGADGKLGGRGQAKWGLIMGWVGVALTLVMATLVAVYFATG